MALKELENYIDSQETTPKEKLFNKNNGLNKEITIDDIIHRLVALHKITDENLKELAEMCAKGEDVR